MPVNRGCEYREIVDARHAGRPVVVHLSTSWTHTTPAGWEHRIALGEVEVEGRTASPEQCLRAGQTLVWHRPPWEEGEVPRHFTVLHDDGDVLAVVKPRGLPTMPGGGFLDGTLLSLVRARFPQASPMHRLGRETSGIVVFARHRESASSLARSWREHAVKKQYRALGSGIANWKTLDVKARIGPVPHPTLGTVHAASPVGKPAGSHARVLERRTDSTLFLVDITTGRPHQIRIHLAFAGFPLVGDPLYVAGGLPRPLAPGLPGDGGYFLHAETVEFAHPRTGAVTTLHAPPPEELTERE